ncbi:MAG: DNA/RNA nuclease SfsA, partial [Candidatus Bathycorpusculaceae bacterium]
KEGYRACILFLIQRTDAYTFSPADEVDEEFGEVLRHAFKGGVEVYAYASEFLGDKIMLRGKVEVKL